MDVPRGQETGNVEFVYIALAIVLGIRGYLLEGDMIERSAALQFVEYLSNGSCQTIDA